MGTHESVSGWFFVVAAALFGAVAGSFVNAAVHRLPRGISLLTRTRSFCPQCEALIAWYDNVPILSFLALRGHCRACGKPIPPRYLLVELLVAALFALSAWQYFVLNAPALPGGNSKMPWIVTAVQMFLIADLVCLACTDLETWYIPIQTTWPWILAGLLLAPFFPELHLAPTPWTGSARWDALLDSFQGLVAGAGVPWLVGFVCVVLLGKEGMGGGDSHLVGMLGALLGWKQALLAFILGIFIGAAVGITVLLVDRIQHARLGDGWKPRQPAFELPTDEESAGPPSDWPLLAMGGTVLLFEGGLAWLYFSRSSAPGFDATLISPVLGALLGLILIQAYFVRKRMLASGRWPQGETRVREDGKKEEVLQGNYIPFGPSLALAGLVVVFYDPLLRAVLFFHLFRIWPGLPFKLPGMG